MAIPTPDNDLVQPDSEEANQFYERAIHLFGGLRALAAEAGLSANADKCKIFVPLHMPDPTADQRSRLGIEIVWDGVVICGAPIGRQEFVDTFFKAHIASVKRKLEALHGIHPQVGMPLLTRSIQPSLQWAFQVTPPDMCDHHAKDLDDLLWSAVLSLVQPDTHPTAPACSDDRTHMARWICNTPTRFDGGGLISFQVTAAPAFYASLAYSIHYDEQLRKVADALSDHADRAHRVIKDLLGAYVTQKSIDDILPRCPTAVLVPAEFYEDKFESDNLRLQHDLTALVQLARFNKGRQEVANSATTLAGDAIALFTPGSKRNQMLTARQSTEVNRLSRAEAISNLRSLFLLPQLPHIGNAEGHQGLDYLVEKCLNASHEQGPGAPELTFDQQVLDLHGGHARSNCPPCKQGSAYAHNTGKDLIRTAAEDAGHRAGNEPTHDKLLSDQDPDTFRRLFPKYTSVAAAEQACELITELHDIEAIPWGDDRVERQRLFDLAVADLHDPGVSLTLDVNINDPACKMPSVLIDFGTTCPFAESNVGAERKAALARISHLAADPHSPLPAGLRDSPSVKTYARHKLLRYKPLLHAIACQRKHGHRHDPQPLFVALIISTLGVISEDWGPLKCYLRAAMHRKLQALGPRDDSRTNAGIVGAYLSDLKVSLVLATQRGLARSMLAQGKPYHPRSGRGSNAWRQQCAESLAPA